MHIAPSRSFPAVILFVLLHGCGGEMMEPSDGAYDSRLDGVWEYVHLETPDGVNTTQKGYLVVFDGFMCHLRLVREREPVPADTSEEERRRLAAAAFDSANATCGNFEITDGGVRVTWTTSLDPSQEGRVSEYDLDLDLEKLRLAPAGAPEFRFVYRKRP